MGSIPSSHDQTRQFKAVNSMPLDIQTARLYHFRIPLTQTLSLGSLKIEEREGLILMFIDANGLTGLGEISPLPGFSRESLASLIPETKMLMGKFTSAEENLISEDHLPPALSFGIDSARYSLMAVQSDLDLSSLIFGNSSSTVLISGLIMGSPDHWPSQALQQVSRGYSTLKIKVGRHDHREEAQALHELIRSLDGNIRLRLDANRAWNLETALNFCQQFPLGTIEYLEEPLARPEDLPLLAKSTDMPFALDETLRNVKVLDTLLPHIRAFILKPTLLGSFQHLLDMLDLAGEYNIRSIISSSFESDIGLNTLAQIAGGVQGSESAAGLDTRNWLKGGTSRYPVEAINGHMSTRPFRFEDLDLSACRLIHEC